VSQQVNLYNPALAPKVEILSGRAVLLGLLGVFIVGLLGFAAAALEAARVAAQEAQQAGQLALLQTELTQLSQQAAARHPSPQLQEELSNLEVLLAARNEVMATIQGGALGDTRGVSEYFRAFSRETMNGLWLTGFSIAGAGSNIVIQGRTLDADLVPSYLSKLRGEAALRGHGFESLSVFQPPPVAPGADGKQPSTANFLEFRLATLGKEGGIDLRDAAKPGVAR
jgi:hypothetical protein